MESSDYSGSLCLYNYNRTEIILIKNKSSCVSIHTRYNGTKLSKRKFVFVFPRYYISGNVKRHILDHHVCTTITQKIHRDTELSEWVFLCQFTLDPMGTNFLWGCIWISKVIYNRYVKTTLSNLNSN